MVGHTRLRFVSAKQAEELTEYLELLPMRVQIYEIVWNQQDRLWYLWFVPGDSENREVNNTRIERG